MVQALTKKDAEERVKDHKGNSTENCNLSNLPKITHKPFLPDGEEQVVPLVVQVGVV